MFYYVYQPFSPALDGSPGPGGGAAGPVFAPRPISGSEHSARLIVSSR